jgi:hypothetical protein
VGGPLVATAFLSISGDVFEGLAVGMCLLDNAWRPAVARRFLSGVKPILPCGAELQSKSEELLMPRRRISRAEVVSVL